MVRSWLLRVVFLFIAGNSLFPVPNSWARGDQNPSDPGTFSVDRIMAAKILLPLLFKNWSSESQQPNPVPEITALVPEQALRWSEPGLLTIIGTGFIDSSKVFFNAHLLSTSLIDKNHLQATIPPSVLTAAGVFPVAVNNPPPEGGLSNIWPFPVLNPTPVLSALHPSSMKARSPGVTLTLTGSGFESPATVFFNDSPVPATWISHSEIEAAIPAEAVVTAGGYPVLVINPAPGGGRSAALVFEVTPAANVAPLPTGSFGKPYEDLFPVDATIPSYDPKRFSLITGQIRQVNGDPLFGVAVSIQEHIEYGTATTDMEGRYSLPVNGGGRVTAAYRKPGFLSAHRTIEVGWNTIAVIEDLILIAEDSAATVIAFDGLPTTTGLHTSSPVTDSFGRRSLSLVFSGDNRALVKDAQGNEQILPQITVRATEFPTPESMPAKLPPSSAFTYCAELTVDGADAVRFEKPVVVYVDNFLRFGVGEIVPVGFYDRDRAVWVPADNGVVVQLLDTDNDGIVDAYTDGRNQYPAPGLTDPARFAPNNLFWRVAVSHFTPWDCNWPYGPAQDAIAPNPAGPPITAIKGKECELTHLSSYVENQECTFHEDLPIPGTELFLHYASNRTAGFKPRITIPASGPSVPTSLIRIIVKMDLAGQVFETTLPPQPNRQVEFIWDGRDYLGREVTGSTTARVRIGFEYPTVYYSGSSIYGQSFAQPGTTATWVQARENVIAWKESALTIHREKADLAEGWTLSAHHLPDPIDPNTLHKGDGTRLTNSIRTLTTVAAARPAGDGSSLLKGVVVDKAGTIYFSDGYNYRYMKADPGGGITYYNLLDTNIGMVMPAGLALDGAGNLVFTNPDAYQGGFVGKIDPEGFITILAGNRQPGFSGDGGPATAARLNYPEDLAVDAYGNIYIADTWNNRIRKVDPNGVITTIAGNGQWGFSGDGGPATEASLRFPSGLALDSQGNVFFTDTDNNRVRKVDPSGVITTIAGNGQPGFSGDGGPATQAGLAYPEGLALDRTGNLYIADAFNYRIRKVNTAGIISTLAGNGQRENNHGEGGPATQATVHDPTGVAVDSSGNVYVAIHGFGRIKKVSLTGAFKSQAFSDDTVFTDENGQGYSIGSSGSHQSTYDLATGKTLLTFSHDEGHKLVSVTDRFGNQAIIQRDGNGVPLSITSPDGVVTRLTVDRNNQLTAVTYPDDGVHTFSVYPGGPAD